MSEYKGIRGWKVQTVSTDPAASIAATGTWASGGDLNTARRDAGGAGTQTAAQLFFGQNATPTMVAFNEYYDGTSWSEQVDGNTARAYGGGLGLTQTASLYAGGYSTVPHTNNEVWNGSSWTEVNDLNTGRENLDNATAGSSTAGLIFGGYSPGDSPVISGKTESWNGTSWTEVNDLNTARYESGGSGTQTAAINSGGYSGTQSTASEQWNGTSWTSGTSINTARSGLASAGTTTSNLIFGGGTPGPVKVANTEFWDGSSWTELADLAVARNLGNAGMGSTSSSTLFSGGSPASPPAGVVNTEEWTVAPPTTFSKSNPGQVFYNSTSNAFKFTILHQMLLK